MNARLRGELFLLICTLIWGGTFVAIRIALTDSSPLMLVFVRFVFSTLLFTPFLIHAESRPRLPFCPGRSGKPKPFIRSALQGITLALFMFIGFGLQTMGLRYTTASRSAFITEMLVVFTPILNFLLFRQRPGMGNLLGILMILPGMYLLTEPDGGGEANIGDWITLVGAIGFSLYIIFLDRYTRDSDLFRLLFWQMLGATVYSGVCALLFEEIRFRTTLNLFWMLIYLAPIATVLTLYLQNRYQKETTSVRAGILFAMEPVFATALAVIILDEFPGQNSFAGGALIVTGVIVSGVLGSRSGRVES